jgi:hypothetical protein
MAKKTQTAPEVANATPATENQTAPAVVTPQATAEGTPAATATKTRKPSLNTVLKAIGFARIPTLVRGEKAPAVAKEKVHLTGPTVDVAIIRYSNWRSSEGDGTPEKPGKWGVDEIVNGIDDKAARKARFRPDLNAIVVKGVGQKYGGYISADPKHVDEVVAILRKWHADNEAKPTFEQLCETAETEEQVIEAIKNGNVRVAPQFTMLEHFVEVPAKVRKERAKKVVPEVAAEGAAPVENAEVAVA